MAKMEMMVPMVLKYEAGVDMAKLQGRSLTEMFEMARSSGWSNDASDPGGATMCGVTLGTLTAYRRKRGMKAPTAQELREISAEEWMDVMRSMYWDRWHGDRIEDQGVAEMLVDWLWHSGAPGIREPQRVVGVPVDGLVGDVTLRAVNARGPSELLGELGRARRAFLEGLIAKNPRLSRYRRGWMRRVCDFETPR